MLIRSTTVGSVIIAVVPNSDVCITLSDQDISLDRSGKHTSTFDGLYLSPEQHCRARYLVNVGVWDPVQLPQAIEDELPGTFSKGYGDHSSVVTHWLPGISECARQCFRSVAKG